MSALVTASVALLAVLYLAAAAAATSALLRVGGPPLVPLEVAGLATVLWAGIGLALAIVAVWLFHRPGPPPTTSQS